MKPDAWMPYYGSDFERDTKGWSRSDRWSYFSALWAYWLTQGKGLLDDDDILRGICECEKECWPRLKRIIFGGRPFFYKEVNTWHQKRGLEEINKSKSLYHKKMNQTLPARLARGLHVTDNVTSPASLPVTGSTVACGGIMSSVLPEKGMQGEKQNMDEPNEHTAEIWRVSSVALGSDYTKEETRFAFLALKANGFKWGRADWRAALERQIGVDRGRGVKSKGSSRGSDAQSLFLAKEELDRVEKSIQNIRNSYDPHSTWDKEDVVKIKELKGRQSELKTQLNFKA